MSDTKAAPASKLVVVRHESCKLHDTGRGHPESAQRYDAVLTALQQAPFAGQLEFVDPRPATLEEIGRCHQEKYVTTAKHDIGSGRARLTTGDTAVCRASWDAALQAAGGPCTAIDAVFSGRTKTAFCVLRPPGHHATPNRGMGFCVFNNVAVAARYAQAKHCVGKVLIVDWDVHHGNGTQDIFYEDDSVFFFSTHQSPWYPGTGAQDETGHGRGLGSTMNRPFPSGSGRKEILGAFQDDLVPALEKFKPELVLISAGFDSRHDDPLGEFTLRDDDFVDLTRLMRQVAKQHAEGRVVSLLEGGYNLRGLASAAQAHAGALCG